MDLQKNELITKLENISALYANTVAIRSEMDTFTPEDNYERKISVPPFPGEYTSEKQRKLLRDKIDHTYEGALEIAEDAHRRIYTPQKPKEPVLTEFQKPVNHILQEIQRKCKSRSRIAVGVGIFCLLGMFSCLQSRDFGISFFLLIIVLACAGAFSFFRKKGNETKSKEENEIADALLEHNRQLEERKEEHAKKMRAYENECIAYEAELQKFLKDYQAWREIYIQSVNEEAYILDKLEADRVSAVKKIYEERYTPAVAALNETNDLITDEYLPVLNVIIDLLKSGRADDLKEAINLFEDIVYRERQLALEREKEEQRRLEEEQRRRDEERRHREDMQFRKDQERQRQREEERRQQDAERRHREEMDQRERQERDRQNEERRRADEERRRADRAELDRKQEEERNTRDQCNRCAQNSHCSMAFRRPNCASFRPR